MHRRLRTCRLLPPRNGRGARSSKTTREPRAAAASAAQSAALPPPSTATSYMFRCTGAPSHARSVFNAQRVLNAEDAGDAAGDRFRLAALDLGVDDARQQDAAVAHDDVNRRNRLRRVVREVRVA